jgi:hypothetical protein
MKVLRAMVVIALGAPLAAQVDAVEQPRQSAFSLTGAVLISHQPEGGCPDGSCGPNLLTSVGGDPVGGFVGLELTARSGFEMALEASSTAWLEGSDPNPCFGCSPDQIRHRDTLTSFLLGWRIAGDHAALDINVGASAVFGSTQFVSSALLASDTASTTAPAITGGFDISAAISRQLDVVALVRYSRVSRADADSTNAGLGKDIFRAGLGLRLRL